MDAAQVSLALLVLRGGKRDHVVHLILFFVYFWGELNWSVLATPVLICLYEDASQRSRNQLNHPSPVLATHPLIFLYVTVLLIIG
jgi:hypothetical protein